MSYTYTEYNRPSVQGNTYNGYTSLGTYNAPMGTPYNYSATPLLKQGGQGVVISPSFGGSGYLKLQHGIPQPSNRNHFLIDAAYKTGPGCSQFSSANGRFCNF